MGKMTVQATVRDLSAAEVYRRIAAFPDYPDLCEAVRAVKVVEADERHMVSEWEVNFHRGVLRWTEHAEFRSEEGLIPFYELAGDCEEFRGHWLVERTAEDTVGVQFFVEFDIGIPTLEHILEPIAEEALHENIVSILTGLLGEKVTIEPTTGPTAGTPSR